MMKLDDVGERTTVLATLSGQRIVLYLRRWQGFMYPTLLYNDDDTLYTPPVPFLHP